MAENHSLRALKEEEREIEQQQREGEEEEKKVHSELRKSFSSHESPDRSSVKVVFRDKNSQSKTLIVPSLIPSSANKHGPDCSSFSQLFVGSKASTADNSPPVLCSGEFDVKPRISTSSASIGPLESKGQFEMSHQEILPIVTAPAPQYQSEMQVQVGCPPSSSELSPVSLTKSMTSEISSTPLQQRLPDVPQDKSICTSEVNQQNSSDQQTKPADAMVKTPSTDGYNWRKYGQKLVKSSESSRSYYRCTHVNCYAKKKVEHCDRSGQVIEILYKGRHNHEPPRKIRFTKARRLVSSVEPGEGSGTIDLPVRKLNDSDLSTFKKESRHGTPEQKQYSPSKCDRTGCVRAEEHDDEPDAKRRMKERSVADSAPSCKTAKEPKIVVQAAGDVGISGDGYRWRKYGQKMVKGNPNPRSYYKCTSAGCPVRKHVERATGDTSTVIITYEGKHDHDMPVPKKRHGPPSAALLIAAAAAMNSAQLKKSETLANQKPPKAEVPGDKSLDLGGEKVLESARTLLSIGIELRPC